MCSEIFVKELTITVGGKVVGTHKRPANGLLGRLVEFAEHGSLYFVNLFGSS